jgi:hypothetical protein
MMMYILPNYKWYITKKVSCSDDVPPKQIYDISIMFHTDAMICHGHLVKMEWVEFKATHFDGCKGFISRC